MRKVGLAFLRHLPSLPKTRNATYTGVVGHSIFGKIYQMNNKTDFVSVGRYLTHQESENIKGQLNSLKVQYIVSGHGPNNGYPVGGDASEYFEIKVGPSDINTGRQIIQQEKQRSTSVRAKCPKCGFLGYRVLEKTTLFDKVYYFGTTLVECRKCKKRYSI